MSAWDLVPLASPFFELCLAGAAVGCIFTLLQCCFVLGFAGHSKIRNTTEPAVTVLKPLHGAEPGLAERLARFYRQDYAGPVQLLCGTHAAAASTDAIMQQLAAEFPNQDIELVVEARSQGSNGKVSNLISMQPHARYEILVLSDSDIVVEPDYVRKLIALLEPRVGAVTCLYYGIGDGLWQRLSALTINANFLPQAILAAGLGLMQHCSGATIALRRSLLDRIGGFEFFANELADDYAIGDAVRSLGYEIVTAPFLVGHQCLETNFRQLLRRQIRAARTIRSIAPIGYAGSILLHPWPLALIGALSGSLFGAIVPIAALALRLALCCCVGRRFGLARRDYWLVPFHDILAFAVYLASFFGKTVHWRGSQYRVTADGMLIEPETEQI